MIVKLVVAGQPTKYRINIPSSTQPDPFLRASVAARVAYTSTAAALHRARARVGTVVQFEPSKLVGVTAVYCCDRCQSEGKSLAFANPLLVGVRR